MGENIYAVRRKCVDCSGRGYIILILGRSLNPPIRVSDCPMCNGTGIETFDIDDRRIISKNKKLVI